MPNKRLSDAVIRGFGKLTPRATAFLDWDSRNSLPCGCALGAALLDCISEQEAKSGATEFWMKQPYYSGYSIIKALQVHFPWFTYKHEQLISNWFFTYKRGDITYQELITRIRELEEPFMKEEVQERGTPSREYAETQTTQDERHLIPA